MERIQLPDSETGLYFCGFWCAEFWIAAHRDTYPSIDSVECAIRSRDCFYCASCGARIAVGTDCVFCADGRRCPPWDWIMTGTALDFAHALARRGQRLTSDRQAAAEFLSMLEPGFSGEELAQIILGGPPGHELDRAD